MQLLKKKNLFSLASPRFHTVCKKLDYSINNPKKCRWEENKFSHFETHQSAVKSVSVIFNHIKLQWNKLNFYKYLGVTKKCLFFDDLAKEFHPFLLNKCAKMVQMNKFTKLQSSQYWTCLVQNETWWHCG